MKGATGSFTLTLSDARLQETAAQRRGQNALRLEEAKETLAKRQANAAVALLNLNHQEKVWALLQHRLDPRLRSYLVHRFAPLGADPKILFARFLEEKDVSAQRALLLALGSFADEELPRASWVGEVLKTYRNDADPGLHGAAEWLLRQWKEDDKLKEIDQALATGKVEGKRHWYVNKQGQTFSIISPKEFWMGSPPQEAGRFGGPEGKEEMKHRRKIGRSFAIATKEVTVAQFRACPVFAKHAYNKQYAPTLQHPINLVTWYQAAEYCNWLSKQEGLQECYEPNSQGQYAEGMKMKPNYLQLTGYRLPTEAEWEYACRAEAVTSRFYGETEELLGKYAWYTKNSLDRWMLPAANLKPDEPNLKPNDFGLFHMLGNAFEWCHDDAVFYRPGTADNPQTDPENNLEIEKGISDKRPRVLRGGSFNGLASLVFIRVFTWRSQRTNILVFTSGLNGIMDSLDSSRFRHEHKQLAGRRFHALSRRGLALHGPCSATRAMRSTMHVRLDRRQWLP